IRCQLSDQRLKSPIVTGVSTRAYDGDRRHVSSPRKIRSGAPLAGFVGHTKTWLYQVPLIRCSDSHPKRILSVYPKDSCGTATECAESDSGHDQPRYAVLHGKPGTPFQ